MNAKEILPEGFKCPHCGGTEFEKEKDIMDVWFDSGTSHAAVLETRDDLRWPADMYLEGSDQHRGWFQSSLLTSVAARHKAPYKMVLTHGFTVDGEGKKMSKSLGNTIAPEEVINKYGADIIRLWAISSDYSVDIRISEAILQQLADSYRKIRNTIRFMLGNLNGFNPETDIVSKDDMPKLDLWLMDKTQRLIKEVRKAYEEWQFHSIAHKLLDFCNIDLSSFYLDIVKDRLYCSGPTTERKSAQTVIFNALNTLLTLLAPILAFTTEEAYNTLKEEILKPAGSKYEESVHLLDFPIPDNSFINDQLRETWNKLIDVRKDVLKEIEVLRGQKIIGHSLESEVTIYADESIYHLLQENFSELEPMFVVSKVTLLKKGEATEDIPEDNTVLVKVKKSDNRKCKRCWKYDETVGKDPKHPDLCERCATVVEKYYT